jgi:hypothetical protein
MRKRTASRLGWPVTALLLLMLMAALVIPASATAATSPEPTAVSGLAPAALTPNLITNITYNLPSPSILHFNDNVNLTFNYQTDEPGGVLIFARPFTSGALTPNYAASGSPLYATGSGTGSGFFTITSGPVTVEQIRFQMWNATQTRLIFQGFVPVHYQFGTLVHDIYGITLSPMTPNSLANGQDVTVNFNYQTGLAGGVRIFARPLTAGAPTPNYGASGSPLYPTGSGSGSGTFTILSGSAVVDQIRFQMYDANQTVLLYEVVIPVSYAFGPAANSVTGIGLSPMNPNILDHGQNVNLTFNYQTDEPGGVLIFARPFSHGALTPNYAASGSPLYATGSGTGTGFFTITSGPLIVDGIRFQILNASQTAVLFETVIPVHYQFGVVKRIYLPLLMQ